jgi:hypothetical protein
MRRDTVDVFAVALPKLCRRDLDRSVGPQCVLHRSEAFSNGAMVQVIDDATPCDSVHPATQPYLSGHRMTKIHARSARSELSAETIRSRSRDRRQSGLIRAPR